MSAPTWSDFMLIEAMKSAGPKMIVSTRGEAAAISSTLTSPAAFSISASMPIRPRPVLDRPLEPDRARLEPDRLLDRGEREVEPLHVRRRLHLRQHDAVEVRP